MTEEPLRATVSQRAVLFDGEEMLVVRRASDGGWELPGGRLDVGESTVDGLRREVREETGLDVVIRRPIYTISWRNDRGEGRYGVYYLCVAETTAVTLSHEHTAYDWLAPSAAADRLSDTQATAVERAQRLREGGLE
ncbi:ADP-ribose pyrophosphatase YjhB, NUDIX family [Halogranum gelatinilyticum]|uniref:ADP-ribose pyrophosphatase YjhB, NUDIX family n=1 Tax=Halogranum gelatinilyticum TaxID=660521 RepID=A0A1G9PP90_9EURY|nr:NUDIX domain-containing protein [Halogranum gelatinilyticum]SDM00544.1 ADP-ribose pyrophosphatase YjhB, NUDIX family [Halogranum gelatinilyticum]